MKPKTIRQKVRDQIWSTAFGSVVGGKHPSRFPEIWANIGGQLSPIFTHVVELIVDRIRYDIK